MRFFDTNILVYAATNQEPHKADIARELIQHALEVNHDGVISVQVMTEFANVMKTRFNAAATEIDEWVSQFYPLLVTEVTMDVVRDALYIKEEYGIQFYDALIVATAEKLGCHEIVTEDLNPNQTYRGMAVVNPFK
ncbi:MAG: PIN domain-containing protein [Kiritimatiellae bacterium]|nr:PIN domain-containing protein [Kiritimatiellia bacterium]